MGKSKSLSPHLSQPTLPISNKPHFIQIDETKPDTKITTKQNKSKKKNNKSNANECDCKILETADIEWFCTKGCVCLKNKSQCSVLCECRGTCSNTSSPLITEELFFKVWRNIVLRKKIIGDKNREIIENKINFRNELLSTLDKYQIQYFENDIIQYTKLFPSISLDTILNKYFSVEIENRKTNIILKFKEHSSKPLFRLNSDLIKKYINTLLPDDQLKLPTIEEIITQEMDSINLILDELKIQFTNDGISYLYDPHYKYIQDYITSCSNNPKELILSVRYLFRIFK